MEVQGEVVDPKGLYDRGLYYLDHSQLTTALVCFQQAFDARPSSDLLPSIQSYLGYTLVMAEGKDIEGMRLMMEALRQEYCRADFFANLGKAYLHRKQDRKKALNAFYNGLKYCPNDPEIMGILKEIGTRKPPPVKFLPRKNPINIWIGRKLRQRQRRIERQREFAERRRRRQRGFQRSKRAI